MPLDPAQLPNDIATLKAMLVAANVRVSSLDAEIANLKLTIAKMQRAEFGASVMPEACVPHDTGLQAARPARARAHRSR